MVDCYSWYRDEDSGLSWHYAFLGVHATKKKKKKMRTGESAYPPRHFFTGAEIHVLSKGLANDQGRRQALSFRHIVS